MDYATALNEEIRDLFSAGADVVQVDELGTMQARMEDGAVRGPGAELSLDGIADDRGPYLFLPARPSFTRGPAAIRFYLEPRSSVPAIRSRSRRRSPSSTARCLPWRGKKSCRRSTYPICSCRNSGASGKLHLHGATLRFLRRSPHHRMHRLRHEVSAAGRRVRQTCRPGTGAADAVNIFQWPDRGVRKCSRASGPIGACLEALPGADPNLRSCLSYRALEVKISSSPFLAITHSRR